MHLPDSDLSSLMKCIADGFPFNGESYPGFDKLPLDQKELFIVSHSVLHMNKSLGRIAAEAESAGHGDVMDLEKLNAAAVSMVVHSLRLVEAIGLSSEDVIQGIFEAVKPQ